MRMKRTRSELCLVKGNSSKRQKRSETPEQVVKGPNHPYSLQRQKRHSSLSLSSTPLEVDKIIRKEQQQQQHNNNNNYEHDNDDKRKEEISAADDITSSLQPSQSSISAVASLANFPQHKQQRPCGQQFCPYSSHFSMKNFDITPQNCLCDARFPCSTFSNSSLSSFSSLSSTSLSNFNYDDCNNNNNNNNNNTDNNSQECYFHHQQQRQQHQSHHEQHHQYFPSTNSILQNTTKYNINNFEFNNCSDMGKHLANDHSTPSSLSSSITTTSLLSSSSSSSSLSLRNHEKELDYPTNNGNITSNDNTHNATLSSPLPALSMPPSSVPSQPLQIPKPYEILPSNCAIYGWGTIKCCGEQITYQEDNRYKIRQLEGREILQIESTMFHSLVLSSSGEVFACGNNFFGQLGLGHFITTNQFKIIDRLGQCKIVRVAAGSHHSLALTNQGQVYAWGRNTHGQLGLNDHEDRNIPTLVKDLQHLNIVKISATYHSLVLTDKGEVFACGNGYYGQLGNGDRRGRSSPTKVKLQDEIVEICTGGEHSLALSSKGRVFSWGSNLTGQLGLGDTTDQTEPQVISALKSQFIKQISCNSDGCFAISSDGVLFSWGNNNSGQLGVGCSTECVLVPQVVASLWRGGFRIKKIASGADHSLVMTNEGRVFAFGFNSNGQLGLNDRFHRNVPHEVAFVRNKAVCKIHATGNISFAFVRKFKGWPFSLRPSKNFSDLRVVAGND